MMKERALRYRVFSGLQRQTEPRGFSLENHRLQTSLGLSNDYQAVVDFFKTPKTAEQFKSRFGAGLEALEPLLQNGVLGLMTEMGLRPKPYVAARSALVEGLGPRDVPPTGRPRRLPRLSDRLKLGKTGLRVSPYMLGIAESAAQVTRSFEAGVNFFFLTADVHWPTYEGLRLGLRKLLKAGPRVRNQLVVAVTVYGRVPVALTEVLESVPELKRLDVLVVGAVEDFDIGRRLPAFSALRAAERYGVRGVGASFHHLPTCAQTIEGGAIDLALMRFSASRPHGRRLFASIEPRPRPLLYAFKVRAGSVTPEMMNDPALGLPEGAWQPSIVDHYRFALSQPQLDGILFSAVGQRLQALIRATESGPLSPVEEQYLQDLFTMARWSVAPEFSGYEHG